MHGPAGKLQAYDAVLQYLTKHGYTQWTRYQPGSRFWPFQWIESGWLLALTVLLRGLAGAACRGRAGRRRALGCARARPRSSRR